MTGAAGGHLVDVHVETSLLVPGQQSVIVIHLTALRFVVVAHIATATSGLADNELKSPIDLLNA